MIAQDLFITIFLINLKIVVILNNFISVVNKIVNEISRNHTQVKSILDVSFNRIYELLKRKTKQQGKDYYQIDTYYPSSKKCSHCGEITKITDNLSIRKRKCKVCVNINDQDINASINIMFEGLKLHYQS